MSVQNERKSSLAIGSGIIARMLPENTIPAPVSTSCLLVRTFFPGCFTSSPCADAFRFQSLATSPPCCAEAALSSLAMKMSTSPVSLSSNVALFDGKVQHVVLASIQNLPRSPVVGWIPLALDQKIGGSSIALPSPAVFLPRYSELVASKLPNSRGPGGRR